MEETPVEIRTRDPLSELTRKERRNLLAISAAAIVVVKTGLVPTKLSGLGIDVSMIERSAFLKILAGSVVYFLLAFVIYAVSDWLAGRWRLQLVFLAEMEKIIADTKARPLPELGKGAEAEREYRAHLGKSTSRLTRATTPIVAGRAVFEFAIPVGLAVYALQSLMKVW